jgi:hypothetical protein
MDDEMEVPVFLSENVKQLQLQFLDDLTSCNFFISTLLSQHFP